MRCIVRPLYEAPWDYPSLLADRHGSAYMRVVPERSVHPRLRLFISGAPGWVAEAAPAVVVVDVVRIL